MHFADIKVSDLVRVTEEAEVVHGHHAVNAAGFAIHSEIHQAHPWINAVCHAHSTAGKAWSVFGEPLPPLTQDSLKFHGGHTAVLHEYHGPVVTTAEGQAIAGVTHGPCARCTGSWNSRKRWKPWSLLTTRGAGNGPTCSQMA